MRAALPDQAVARDLPSPASSPALVSSNAPAPSSTLNLLWAMLDFATAFIAGFLVYSNRVDIRAATLKVAGLGGLAHSAATSYLVSLFLFSVYLVIVSSLLGRYRQSNETDGLHEQRMIVQATMMAALLLCGTLYVFEDYLVSRLTLLLTIVLTLFMLMTQRLLRRKVLERRYLSGRETRNVLIVGHGELARGLRSHIERLPHLGFRFKGFISVDPRVTEHSVDGVIGDVENCVALARLHFVDEIYLSTSLSKRLVLSIVEDARAMGISVSMVPELYDGFAFHAPVEYLGQVPTIPLHHRELRREALFFKRVIDVGFSSLALILLAPVFLVIALCVTQGSSGPVFYRAKRIGRKGQEFACFKFRTMVQDADQRRDEIAHLNERKGVLFKIVNDPRVTRFGAILRKYSLDELPQLVNVLRGEMSLVGPRPPIASEVQQYELAHLRRLDVMPGMTGLWQIEGRQDPSFESYITMDIAYVENWSLRLDFRILARTVGVVLGGTGS